MYSDYVIWVVTFCLLKNNKQNRLLISVIIYIIFHITIGEQFLWEFKISIKGCLIELIICVDDVFYCTFNLCTVCPGCFVHVL